MATKSIHVVAVTADDWVVREDGGRELGHYPSRQDALSVGRKLARTRKVELVVENGSAESRSEQPRKGLFARLFGR